VISHFLGCFYYFVKSLHLLSRAFNDEHKLSYQEDESSCTACSSLQCICLLLKFHIVLSYVHDTCAAYLLSSHILVVLYRPIFIIRHSDFTQSLHTFHGFNVIIVIKIFTSYRVQVYRMLEI